VVEAAATPACCAGWLVNENEGGGKGLSLSHAEKTRKQQRVMNSIDACRRPSSFYFTIIISGHGGRSDFSDCVEGKSPKNSKMSLGEQFPDCKLFYCSTYGWQPAESHRYSTTVTIVPTVRESTVGGEPEREGRD
jgi:hypothetical protein